MKIFNTIDFRKNIDRTFCLSIFFLLPLISEASITLPDIFSDHMVLQQQDKVALWGYAKQNKFIYCTTSWDKKRYRIKAGKKGQFRLYVQTPPAGGPFQLTFFQDGTKIIIHDVMIGEVWLCSGQSNMAMPMSGFSNQPILNAGQILAESENPNIRLFKVQTKRADSPLIEVNGKWALANASSVREFSAIGYLFAKSLQERLKVPVAVIMSAVSASKIEAWMSPEAIQGFKGKKIIKHGSAIIKQNDPTVLYNGMIHPIAGYNLKGVLWYQGEGNRSDHAIYDQLLSKMVTHWRKIWNIGDWSFYYVQIAPWYYQLKSPETIPLLRETQAKAVNLIPNSGMIVSADVGSAFTIHPPDKFAISQRLLYWALGNTYSKSGIDYKSPTYQSFSIKNDTILVQFNDVPRGLTSYDKQISNFRIAGQDKKFYPAVATIDAKTNGIKVFSEKVKSPVAVRYAFSEYFQANLYNLSGLPVCPFRTDAW